MVPGSKPDSTNDLP
ncbi:hypothetical protein AVEN_123971-1, partial [Araneus ventricosus]